MFTIQNGTIALTRGDSAVIKVNFKDYEIRESDVLTLTVRRSTFENSPIILQKSVTGTDLIRIDPADTEKAACRNYIYDIELRTEEGDVYTYGIHDFNLLMEATYGQSD